MESLLFFIGIQFLNVILSTVKSVVLVNGKPMMAGFTNAVYFALYSYIIKLITTESLLTVVLVTFFTNLIGVVIGKKILEAFEKDKLWVYNSFIKGDLKHIIAIKRDLDTKGCYCIYETIKEDKFYSLKIISNKKEKSRYVVNKLNELNARYFVVESKKNGYYEG